MKKCWLILLGCLVMSACQVKKDSRETDFIATPLPSPSQSPGGEPYLFTDESGSVYLSWIEKVDDAHEYKFSTWAGDQWSSPSSIATGTDWFVNWADYPMITKNGNQLLAHYLRKSGEGSIAYDVVLTSSHNEGKTWSSPQVAHDDGKEAEHGFVSLLPYQEGFVVAWLDGRNTVMPGMKASDHKGHEGHYGQMTLRAAFLDKELKKIKEWELDDRTCDCCQTTAAITSNGPVVVYRDRSAEEVRDISIVRMVNGEWTKPVSIQPDNWKIAGCPVNGPRIEANGNKLAIAWFTMANDSASVQVIFSDDGGETFGKPVRLDGGNALGRVDLVLLDDDAMVSWMEGTLIKAAYVNRDGTKGKVMTIASSSESRSSGFPQMTRTGNRVIFAWTDVEEKKIKVAGLDWR